MEIKDLLFTTWFRPKTDKLLILTDYTVDIVEFTTEEGIPCGQELVTTVILTPTGVEHRSKSIAINYVDFTKAVEGGHLVRIYAPDNIHQLSNAIMSIRNKYKPQ